MSNTNSKNAWAIIPARGGSKGIPGKNVAMVAGKPLIAWTIDAARAAASVTRVIVSTDDAEIARVAVRHGAETVMRPAALSGDRAASEGALIHTLESLAAGAALPEITVFLQCTSPLTCADDIDGTVAALSAQQADSAFAACPFHYFLWRRHEDGSALGVNHDPAVRLMRQQREPGFLEAGSVYAMRTEGFLAARHRFFGKTAIHEIPAERRLEIDDPIDLEVADVLLRARDEREPSDELLRPVRAVVFDFDGVMTDNRVTLSETGEESVVCDRGDGMGIEMLKRRGFALYVLSREDNPVTAARCKKLGLDHAQSVRNKLPELESWVEQHGLSMHEVAYLGNDVNDVACMREVGLSVAVADAYPEAKAAARLVLQRPGGRGAVREFANHLLRRARREGAVQDAPGERNDR